MINFTILSVIITLNKQKNYFCLQILATNLVNEFDTLINNQLKIITNCQQFLNKLHHMLNEAA